jgi:hypothetical protein
MSDIDETLQTEDQIASAASAQIEGLADAIHLEAGGHAGDEIADPAIPDQELKKPFQDMFDVARTRFFTAHS